MNEYTRLTFISSFPIMCETKMVRFIYKYVPVGPGQTGLVERRPGGGRLMCALVTLQGQRGDVRKSFLKIAYDKKPAIDYPSFEEVRVAFDNVEAVMNNLAGVIKYNPTANHYGYWCAPDVGFTNELEVHVKNESGRASDFHVLLAVQE